MNQLQKNFAIAMLAGFYAIGATAAPLFKVTDLGTFGDAFSSSGGMSVNNSGVVAGTSISNFVSYGFIFTNGTLQFLKSRSDAIRNDPNSINSSGQIVGVNSIGSSRGFLFSGNTLTSFNNQTPLYDINDLGIYVGQATNVACYGSGGSLILIKPDVTQTNYTGGIARSINNAGEIVGEFYGGPGQSRSGFYYHGGISVMLPAPTNYDNVQPQAINASGVFTGLLIKNSPPDNRAFVCNGPGQPITLIPSKPDWTHAIGGSISDDGTVVGSGGSGGNGSAFLYQNGQTYYLSEIVDASGQNWTFDVAYAISPNGKYVTGTGYHGAYPRAFLLSPVTENIVITKFSRSGNILLLDFTGTPAATGWQIKASTNLPAFNIDKTADSVITESSAGVYHAVVTLNGTAPAAYFLRIAKP